MKKYLSIILGIFLIFSLVGCNKSIADPSDKITSNKNDTMVKEPVYDFSQLMKGLQELKHPYEITTNVKGEFLSVNYTLVKFSDNSMFSVYEYNNPKQLEKDKNSIDSGGCGIGKSEVDFIAPPHWYSKGKLILLYVGNDTNITTFLETKLGQPFAGFDLFNSKPIEKNASLTFEYDLPHFFTDLNSLSITFVRTPEQKGILPATKTTVLSLPMKETIYVFEYKSAQALQKEKQTIHGDGTIIGGGIYEFYFSPYWYQKGKLIVLYLGHDQKTLDGLTKYLGTPFIDSTTATTPIN